MVAAHQVHERLRLLDAEQFVRVLAHDLLDVCGKRAFARQPLAVGRSAVGLDPQRGRERAERFGRLALRALGQRRDAVPQQPARLQRALRGEHVLQVDPVRAGRRAFVVVQRDAREHRADVRVHARLRARQSSLQVREVQVRAQVVGQRHRDQRRDAGRMRHLRGLAVVGRAGAPRDMDQVEARRGRLAPELRERERAEAERDQRERPFRETGHDEEAAQHERRDQQRARMRAQLLAELFAELALPRIARRDARRDDAGRDRHEQRRDLRRHPVADRQDRVTLQRLADIHTVHQRADRDPRDDVDEGDHEARDRVALHELHRTVHRAVHLRFLLELLAAFARFVGADDARAQVRVDAHLLARHRIEREARADLGHALRPFRDHDELDDCDHEEHHAAHHDVVADHEPPERVDHVTRVRVQQDQLARRDIQREPEQRREQQQRGKRREADRRRHVGRHRQQHDARGEIQRDHAVERGLRQRQDEQRDDGDDERREEQVGARRRAPEAPSGHAAASGKQPLPVAGERLRFCHRAVVLSFLPARTGHPAPCRTDR